MSVHVADLELDTSCVANLSIMLFAKSLSMRQFLIIIFVCTFYEMPTEEPSLDAIRFSNGTVSCSLKTTDRLSRQSATRNVLYSFYAAQAFHLCQRLPQIGDPRQDCLKDIPFFWDSASGQSGRRNRRSCAVAIFYASDNT